MKVIKILQISELYWKSRQTLKFFEFVLSEGR